MCLYSFANCCQKHANERPSRTLEIDTSVPRLKQEADGPGVFILITIFPEDIPS